MKDAILSVDCKTVVFFFSKIGLEERKRSEAREKNRVSSVFSFVELFVRTVYLNTQKYGQFCSLFWVFFFSFFLFFFCYVNKRAGAKKRQICLIA